MSQTLASTRKKLNKALRLSLITKVLAGLLFMVAYFATGNIMFMVAALVLVAAGIAMALFIRSLKAKLAAGAAAKTTATDAKSADADTQTDK